MYMYLYLDIMRLFRTLKVNTYTLYTQTKKKRPIFMVLTVSFDPAKMLQQK